MSVVSAGLSVYEPGRIKIVVDPHLWHPKLSSVSPERYYDARSALVKQLEPLCGALIVATMGGSFLHTTMEADEELRRVLAENRQRTPLFVSTDGETVLVISIEELKDTHQRQIAPGLASWGFGGRIDAVGLLDPNALSDPFETTNAILIYQAPLFIGMEADMIIYVRNRHEPFETHTELEPSTIERLRHARQQHHFLAMSRAKHSLIDLILESD